MDTSRWWLWSAGFVATMMTVLGVGNLLEDDGGPLYGRIVFAAVMIGGAVLVVTGMRVRSTRRGSGSRLIAVGVSPGALGIAFFWFPPAVAVGILAVATTWKAFHESVASTRGVVIP